MILVMKKNECHFLIKFVFASEENSFNTMSQPSRLAALRANPDTVRAGLKWTDEEDAKLLQRIKAGKEIETIAKQHKRTVTGLKSRIMTLTWNMVQNGTVTLKQVNALFRIPIQDLEEHRERQLKSEQTKIETASMKASSKLSDNVCAFGFKSY